MSRATQLLLKRICNNDDTLYERAKAVLHTATIKTAPGSGYELGQGSSGLPAICAYIAAEELGDTGINEKVAQNASCLNPKIFTLTLNTVKGALAAAAKSAKSASTSPSKSARSVTYNALLVEKKIGRKGMVLGWMQDAERALMANRDARRRFGSYDAVTVAVFCWTCQLMGLGKKASPEKLLDAYDIPTELFDDITEALLEFCQETAKKIEADVASLRAGKSPSKPTASPSKAAASPIKAAKQLTLPPAPILPSPFPTPSKNVALTRSPSKSALRAPSADLSPRKTPSHKRKVAFDGPIEEADEEFDALATPSKRQKFSSPMKETPSAVSTPRKSSRLAQSSTAGEDEQSEPAEPSTLDLLRQARSTPGSAPSTPRKPRGASQPSSTHSTRSGRSGRSQPMTPTRRKPGLGTIHEDEERVGRRRYRPAFADTQQWMRADARLERSLKPWAERWRELVGRCGGDVWEAAKAAGEERRGLVLGAAS